MREYLFVAQNRMHIERYTRHDNAWLLTEATGEDGVIDLPSIGCALALRDVYEMVVGVWPISREGTDSTAQD